MTRLLLLSLILCLYTLFADVLGTKIVEERSICKAVKDGSLPTNVWIQYGHTRSASTLQFMVILLLGNYLCGGNGISVGYGGTSTADNIAETVKSYPNILQIYKCHSQDCVTQAPANAFIFLSGSGKNFIDNQLGVWSKHYNHTVVNVQSYEHVIHRQDQLTDYQKIFLLPQKILDFISVYLRYWEVYRTCCGPQMSQSWREYLQNNKSSRAQTNLDYPACEMYNLSETESLLNNVANALDFVPKRFVGAEKGFILEMTMLPPFVGYCKCTVDLTKLDNAVFNDLKYKDCNHHL